MLYTYNLHNISYQLHFIKKKKNFILHETYNYIQLQSFPRAMFIFQPLFII